MTRRRALLSVWDKTGLEGLARTLLELGFELLSTGGTARALTQAGLPSVAVEAYTGSPEVMGGRVKTLHPKIHGGLLARPEQDTPDLQRLGAEPIELLAVNLYPFEKVAAEPQASWEQLIENIDIGGPAMLRSAAKNHASVTVLCDPSDYDLVQRELRTHGQVTEATRRALAVKVFARTAAYDAAIAQRLGASTQQAPTDFAPELTQAYVLEQPLRYGENPHQRAALYREREVQAGTLACCKDLGAEGKALSYNNYVDLEAALQAVAEFDRPAAVVVKHTNPCGVAVSDTMEKAYRMAREADALSAFGGVVGLNRPVDLPTARALTESFIEAVVAPGFEPEALAHLKGKKNLRLVACALPSAARLTYRPIGGGLLVQQGDESLADELGQGRVVTERAPSPEELGALAFAWKVVKHVKSNAIVLAKAEQTVGVGAGQMSRVDAVQMACAKAAERAKGSVLASDAFFPFADGVELAARQGVTAVVQPGGSVRDAEVIEAANRAQIAMVLTGRRHFRH